MRMVRVLVPLVAALAGLSWLSARPAWAQSEAEVERGRLAAAYAAAPTLSNACSLAEGERRAGLVDDAARRLDALLAAAAAGPPPSDVEARVTLSACRFNRARIHEDRGELDQAYRVLGQALSTPNSTRRRIVEQRMVDVAARLVAALGCNSLGSRFSPEALLRFQDNATLRRCVTTRRRADPFCTPSAAGDIPDIEGRYGVRRPDANTVVLQDDNFLMVITTRGRRVSAIECRLPIDEERLSVARFHQVGPVQLLEVTTTARVGYACDDCGLEGGSCDCGDDSETTYFLGPRGELLLALVPGWVEPGNMAALNSDAAELRDVDASPTRVEGGVLVVNARRLRFVRGALVPAP